VYKAGYADTFGKLATRKAPPHQLIGNVGIGTDSPAQKLDVNGTKKALGFPLPATQSITYMDQNVVWGAYFSLQWRW
jgi:hypothetical protein